LALVQKQENAIISALPSAIIDENGQLDESSYQFLSENQVTELTLLKQRKDAL
jgi:hypothetical protein